MAACTKGTWSYLIILILFFAFIQVHSFVWVEGGGGVGVEEEVRGFFGGGVEEEVRGFFGGGVEEGEGEGNRHTNNWAVLISTSRFWFNYRHVANVLSMYTSIKRMGIPDRNIILMLADEGVACNPRNPRPASVFNNAYRHTDVYGEEVEVDYRGQEVTVQGLVRLLTGRHPPATPSSKRLLSDRQSNVLVYATGHGGNGFLKFQDSEEVSDVELSHALQQMWTKGRYRELLFVADTCQAASLYAKFKAPRVLAVGSSLVGEDSLSHHVDPALGVYVVDRYTFHAIEFLEDLRPTAGSAPKTLDDFLAVCPKHRCVSTVGVRKDLYGRDPARVPVADFFGAERQIRLTKTVAVDLTRAQRPAPSSTADNGTRVSKTERERYVDPLPLDLYLGAK